ncbi:sulfate ABC transporter permease subunit CysW [Achromobacter aloeverae]|uniref:Sulfate transport system permease protein CysW n=1 Tax=Achromobacter aloeverae TaxID=1750518 RepID=A0A4Q1HDD4_9BURK|nr:sulfate ABC transporter permease subunit CysW [Achromobacter aloeverae]RXN83804.1 sulfate ABC transporter permease subunit CysW [Achromobacter aloeverae]
MSGSKPVSSLGEEVVGRQEGPARAAISAAPATAAARTLSRRGEAGWVRVALIAVAVVFLLSFLVLPLGVVFAEAFRKGAGAYFGALADDDSWAAIRLTLLTAAIAVPLNVVFGIAAAWAIARFDFRGKSVLVTLIDVPFSVSPVVAGLAYMLVLGAQGWIGPWLMDHDLKIIFAVPGIVLVTTFVTLPMVARELIPLMQAQGSEQEEAAVVLGASGWRTFWHVTLPNIRWGLIYGVILCNARAMGEFGAVSVVSGHIRGLTNTIPLQVEILYNEYQIQAGFAVASLLALLALLTLCVKSFLEWRHERRVRQWTHAAAQVPPPAASAPAGVPARAPA